MSVRPPSVAFSGVGWRWSDYDAAWWADRNRSHGRWHDEHAPPTQYLSLTALGAWAELIRYSGLPAEDCGDVRVNLWTGWFDVAKVADYSDPAIADRCGFDADALTADAHDHCQLEAQRLRVLGFQGVLTPSAALPGAINLTIWGGRRQIGWVTGDRATGRPPASEFPDEVPTELAARGGPPPDLARRVRRPGAGRVR